VRIVVITPRGEPHHRYFCARLAELHDVVGVLHPITRRSGLRRRANRLRREVARSGVTYAALRTLAELRSPLLGWDAVAAHAEAEERFFPQAAHAYERSVAGVAHEVADVNSAAAIERVRALAPDAVVCLGGPIYRAPLIESAGLMVNFHSGISPLYNGASTIQFAFANGHVRLCGGTLMTMNATVDGGNILAHCLPAIEADDTPATLFMKAVRAAPELAGEFLAHVEREGRFTSAPQSPPLFYYTASDWTLYHSQRIRTHLERRTAARHARDEELVPYWGLPDDDAARGAVHATIERLLELA
jgi:folate-dependent phosphoribosylglycinamide formyltransferase PurN